MAVIEGGTSAALAGVGAESQQGMHVIMKPDAYGSLGHYQASATTGTIAAGMAANGHVFHARWTDATRLALIYRVEIDYVRSITAFAAGNITTRLDFMRSWTVDGSGGTSLTTASMLKKRTSMGNSLFGAIRISTTAALGAGTSTPDTQAIKETVFIANTTANAIQNTAQAAASAVTGMGTPIVLFSYGQADTHPIVLAQNEGIAVRMTVPGTGTWNVNVTMKWAEVTAY